ncbi:hypothetical protein RND71_018562 [Anisodus tanguticus]|uniref:Myb-like domain-containing protein n=1 Tax=Anisodus tanguticus TaxID=243964 RepID=A0AAE1S6D0_9SOLA|nr:hypothetical protein RND71_018562 [Anisodus tanguticus]
MVQGDEKVGILMKSDKKSKKRKTNVRTNGLGATKADVKAVECDISFKEEKLSSVGTRKGRDNAKMETKTPRESEDSDIKRKKERGDGKHPGKSSKDGHEDAVKKVVKKKNKLKNEQETLIMHVASLDTKLIAHESSSETQENKVVERSTRALMSKWTEEECEMVQKFHGEHGPKWKVLADELGKHESHVGNAWHRIKLANRKKGNWAQEEIQTL